MMASYPLLASMLLKLKPGQAGDPFAEKIVPYLVDTWLDDYEKTAPAGGAVQVTLSGFSYLFDPDSQRLIAAWGMSTGKNTDPRPASRMQGHPKSAGALYHRGHAIPHTLGGGTDINLVDQLGKINVGPFRRFEKLAVAAPGSLYFTYWKYAGAMPTQSGHPGQTPTGVDQGFLVPGQRPQIQAHGN